MNEEATKKFDIDQLEILKTGLPDDVEQMYQYEGAFTKEKIRDLTLQINRLTKGDQQAYRKFFYVFIELAQNVANYSDWKVRVNDKEDAGVGALIFGSTKENYFMLIGNVVNNDDLKVLIRKCEIINSLDRESLRLFKRQQRNLIPGTNQNAHIGLIMVALTTRKKLDITIKPIDDKYSFFFLRILIPKNRKER